MTKEVRRSKILEYSKLEYDWDSYKSNPIDPRAIAVALSLNEVFPDNIYVCPRSCGGIIFESDDLYICIESDGSCDVADWLINHYNDV